MSRTWYSTGTPALTLKVNYFISVASPIPGYAFFQNARDTMRQGVEVAGHYKIDRWKQRSVASAVSPIARVLPLLFGAHQVSENSCT
jgi:hypothetical protein